MGFFKRRREERKKQKALLEQEKIRLHNEQIEKEKEHYYRLLQFQQILLDDSPSELIMSETEIQIVTRQQIENDSRIMEESYKIIDETKNPDTFFSRLDLFLERLQHIALFDPLLDTNFSKTLKELEDDLQDIINDFLERYWIDIYDNAQKLKTDSGRKKRLQKYYDTLQPYFNRLNEKNMEFIKNKMEIL